MATGSGKTVVMSMVVAWAFCNRGQNPATTLFPNGVLICCPNLTVKERLQVLRPERPDNYYEAFDIVPVKYRPLMQSGKVLVTNWHRFAPESEHVEGGKSYAVSPDRRERRPKRRSPGRPCRARDIGRIAPSQGHGLLALHPAPDRSGAERSPDPAC
jgi:type III restriction enzyme